MRATAFQDAGNNRVVLFSFDMDAVNEDNIFERQYDEITTRVILEPVNNRAFVLETTFRGDGVSMELFFANERFNGFYFEIPGFPGEAEMERYDMAGG